MTEAREEIINCNCEGKNEHGFREQWVDVKGSSSYTKTRTKGVSSTTTATGGMENLSVSNSGCQGTEFRAGRTAGNLKKSWQQEN